MTNLSKPIPIVAHMNTDGNIPIAVPRIKLDSLILKITATIFDIPNGIPISILYKIKKISSLL